MNGESTRNRFVGLDDLRADVLNGLRQGHSYAIVGGHKCGGTALTKSLHDDIAASGLQPFHAIPCYIDIRESIPRTPFDLFREIYRGMTRDLPGMEWNSPGKSQHYQEFLERVDAAAPLLQSRYGPEWLVVAVIDALDSAVPYLKDDECFHNLRNLLTNSRHQRRFRLVAWGITGMSGLVTKAGSPLNNLHPKYLRLLTEEECRNMIQVHHPGLRDPIVQAQLIEKSGRHPFLLYGILGYHREAPDVPGEDSIEIAVRRFRRDWLGVFK